MNRESPDEGTENYLDGGFHVLLLLGTQVAHPPRATEAAGPCSDYPRRPLRSLVATTDSSDDHQDAEDGPSRAAGRADWRDAVSTPATAWSTARPFVEARPPERRDGQADREHRDADP
jgi:hypothetical protein